jgi:hypothetical protein
VEIIGEERRTADRRDHALEPLLSGAVLGRQSLDAARSMEESDR